jgi:polyhydroxyalkanoate synthesis regulator phasin
LPGGKSPHESAKESLKPGVHPQHTQRRGHIISRQRAEEQTPGTPSHNNEERRKTNAPEGLKLMKGDVKKGDTMGEDNKENVQEYVTKAMVPIEDIDTIVKARTEEISKAYSAQLDEIKKAYDAKFTELASKVEKMENETIRKGGNVVVIPTLLGIGTEGQGAISNADALATLTAGRK